MKMTKQVAKKKAFDMAKALIENYTEDGFIELKRFLTEFNNSVKGGFRKDYFDWWEVNLAEDGSSCNAIVIDGKFFVF